MEPVSIILPTYNRAYCIETAIKSVLNQTYSNFELIIVDDGSTDNTKEIVERINDDRVRYIKLNENAGQSHARNYGVTNAKYSIIAFQDSDDEWINNKLEKQMESILKSPDVGMIYTQKRCVNIYSGKEVLIPGDTGVDIEYRRGKIFPYLLARNFISAPTMLMRKECFEYINGFDEEMHCLEDWDFVLRFAKNYEIEYIDDVLHISYRGNEDSVDSSVDNHFTARCTMLKKFKEDYISLNYLDTAVDEILSKARQMGREREVALLILGAIKG